MAEKHPYDNLNSALRRGAQQAEARKAPAKSGFVRLLKTIFYALIIAFVVGLLIGTLIRREIDKPVRYIGALPETPFSETPQARV